jgi:hypothetical protein
MRPSGRAGLSVAPSELVSEGLLRDDPKIQAVLYQ